MVFIARFEYIFYIPCSSSDGPAPLKKYAGQELGDLPDDMFSW